MDAASAELLKNGILGALLLIALFAIYTMDKRRDETARRNEDAAAVVAKRHEEQLKAIHDQRVADHQAMAAALLRLTTECVAMLTTVSNGLEATKEAMDRWSK